ncbi:MAG: hypothetical protein RR397_04945 [Odoribacter sp.]
MGKYKNIQEDIENITNKEVVKQFHLSGMGMILFVAGILMALGAMLFDDPNSSMSTFLYTTSGCLLIAGLIKLLVSRSCYFFRPTKSRIKELTLYFDVHESINLQTCMEMKRFDELSKLKRVKDAGVKIEAMLAGDQKFAAIQISEYIPYSYEAVTPVLCYYGEDARNLVNYING